MTTIPPSTSVKISQRSGAPRARRYKSTAGAAQTKTAPITKNHTLEGPPGILITNAWSEIFSKDRPENTTGRGVLMVMTEIPEAFQNIRSLQSHLGSDLHTLRDHPQ